MSYEKYDILTLDDNEKVVILEIVNYEGNTYLYVDKVDQEETTTLKKFHILRVMEDDLIVKETDTDVLQKILPQLQEKIKLELE